MLYATYFRYISRSLLVEFSSPALDFSMTEYAALPELMEESSSAVGFIISLGVKFLEEGISEMDNKLLPELRSLLAGQVLPRVLPS